MGIYIALHILEYSIIDMDILKFICKVSFTEVLQFYFILLFFYFIYWRTLDKWKWKSLSHVQIFVIP